MENITLFNSDKKSQKSLLVNPEALPAVSEQPLVETILDVFSVPVAKLVTKHQKYYFEKQRETEIATIHVDEIASKLAFFYEKIRKVVDWKEEHLVRRSAIERILKRKLLSKISGLSLVADLDPDKMAGPIVLELIRGGHFPNDKIPRSKIPTVAEVIKKYIFIFANNPDFGSHSSLKLKHKINHYNWLLEIAACEIEEILEAPIRQTALIDCMVESMMERTRVAPESAISSEKIRIQMEVAVRKTLFHLDSPIITYHLFKMRWQNWRSFSENELIKFSKNLDSIKQEIDHELKFEFSSNFFSICDKYDTVYLLLGDILKNFSKKSEKILLSFSEPKELLLLVKKAYAKRLKTLKKRLYRSAIYSTLSIFLAGALSLFIFEVPLAKLFYGKFSSTAVFVDIMLPTGLMYLLVYMVKPPKKENLARVLKETQKIVYRQKEKDVYEIRLTKRKKSVFSFFVNLLYLAGTALSLGLVFWVFDVARVPVTSLYIDTLNVAMVVFAALVIKQRSKELTIDDKPSVWEFSLDIISVPMAKIGQWLANKWKEYNIVSVFFIALVDMPFSFLVEFVENWSSYLREKKAEIH